MPRDGSGIYHRPAGTDGVPNFPIESAKYNTYIADVEQDLNTPRPIVAGGTGATTAAGAITNLGGEQSHQLVTNYDAMAWVSGSFYSAAGATSAPTANAFSGIVYVTDANNMVVEARDAASKGLYVRVMTAGTWSPWKLDNDLYFLDTAPPGAPDGSMWWETDSGILFVRYNDGSSTQWVPATPQQDLTTRVAKAGDTMTGFLTLVGDPIAPLNAATKQYVDTGISGLTTSTAGAVHYDVAQTLTASQKTQARANIAAPLRGWIAGLTLSAVGSSTTFTVAAGEAADSTVSDLMKLGSPISKTMSTWVVGSGVGGLDTGTIAAATWYHMYIIKRLDTGVVDVLFSLSATAPTLPTNYTLFRRIGSIRCNGATQWPAFYQIGDEFFWVSIFQDWSGASSTFSNVRSTITLTVPPLTKALFRAIAFNATGPAGMVFQPIAEADGGVAATGYSLYTEVTSQGGAGEFGVWTNSSSAIAGRATIAATSLSLFTYGWIDRRGKDA